MPRRMVSTMNALRARAEYVGVQTTPALREHEADRASQRIIGSLAVLIVLTLDDLLGQAIDGQGRILLASVGAYLALTLAYRVFLHSGAVPGIVPVYSFLLLDPALLALPLYLAPQRLGFLNPFLFVAVVRTGIRYGVRTMYLSWTITLLSSTILLTNPSGGKEST